MTRITQSAFTAGIMSQGTYARHDIDKYSRGLADALNVIIKTQGGAANRPGFEAVTKHNTAAQTLPWLIPFSFSTTQTYLLEFGDTQFRIIQDGAYLLDEAESVVVGITTQASARIQLQSAAATDAYAISDLVYFTDVAGNHKWDGNYFRVTGKDGAYLEVTGPNSLPVDTRVGAWGTVTPGSHVRRVFSVPHDIDPSIPRLDIDFAQDRDVLYLAHRDMPPKRVVRSGQLDWVLEDVAFGTTMPVIPSTNVSVTNVTQSDPAVITAPGHSLQNGDAFSVRGIVGMTEMNATLFKASNVTTDTLEVLTRDNEPVDSTGYTPYVSGGTLRSPGWEARIGMGVDPQELIRYKYNVSALSLDGDEGVITTNIGVDNDLYFEGSENRIGWRAIPGASRYVVYRVSAGSPAFVGTTTNTIFVDENITPDTSRGPVIARDPFNGPGRYPALVTFYEQRLVYAATTGDPQLVEMSKVANLQNFNTSFPQQADDARRFRVRDEQVNRIEALLPTTSFMMLTAGGEWMLPAQATGTYIPPDQRGISPVSTYGCGAYVKPIKIGPRFLFLETSRQVIREYDPMRPDAVAPEKTVLVKDLFRRQIVSSWAFAKAPDELLWVVLTDGTLLSMTYSIEQDVWAWTRHFLGGTRPRARQVRTIREGSVDAVYVTVSRDVDGVATTSVERLTQREDDDVADCYYMDGGCKKVFTDPVSEITGFLHLAGEKVVVLADGDVIEDVMVDNTGTISLGARTARKVSVGLPYISRIQLLDVRMDTRDGGSSEGRLLAASEVAVKYERSRGFEVGQRLDRMSKLKEWQPDLMGDPIPLDSGTENFSVEGDWVRDATIHVRQRHPLPMTILGVTPEWEPGG